MGAFGRFRVLSNKSGLKTLGNCREMVKIECGNVSKLKESLHEFFRVQYSQGKFICTRLFSYRLFIHNFVGYFVER